MQQLEQRVAWITGAASGIGLALAHRLAAEKMKLVLVDVEAMEAAVAKARERFGVVQLIVNNAGVGGGGGPMWLLSEADWKWALDVNLWGVIHGIRLLLRPLIESGEEGHVVNTASIAGLTSTPFMGPYTATKHAVVAISECLAKELELSHAKVGVSVLCPGFVKTRIGTSHRNRPDPVTTAANPGAQKFGAVLEQLVAAGKPAEEVADAVVQAVRTAKFYILTHPEMKPQVEYRMRQILDEKQPGIDPLIRSLLGG